MAVFNRLQYTLNLLPPSSLLIASLRYCNIFLQLPFFTPVLYLKMIDILVPQIRTAMDQDDD